MDQADTDDVHTGDPRDTSDLAVVTPTYRPDAQLFADLHASVLRHTAGSVVHHVIVPDVDRELFASFAGPRCRVWTASELMPRRYLKLPRLNYRINVRHPWPPVRGWVMQQALKIAATAALNADVVLMADSDVVLVRDVTSATFLSEDGKLPLFRTPDAVHEGMPDHVHWHKIARVLLGLPPAPAPPLPDYVSALNIWNPATVRAMQSRITEVTGRHWMDAFTAQLQISEFILYGVFVDELVAGPSPWPGETTICHNYWETIPLSTDAALEFADALRPEAVGMMISAKSHTPHDVRRAAIDRCSEAGNGRPIER